MWSLRFYINSPGWLSKNKKVVYDLLFHTSAATVLEIAADAKQLGALGGYTAGC
jgi:hypothetical protein